MNFGGHFEKFGGQNPRNSKKEGGHGKPWVVGPKTRSLGQMLEKPCVRSRGHIFRLIIIKLWSELLT